MGHPWILHGAAMSPMGLPQGYMTHGTLMGFRVVAYPSPVSRFDGVDLADH